MNQPLEAENRLTSAQTEEIEKASTTCRGDVITVNVYELNGGAPKFIKQIQKASKVRQVEIQ